jgi:hypothetical protein
MKIVTERWNAGLRMACGLMLAAACGALPASAGPADMKSLDQPPIGFFTSLVFAHGYKESKDAFQTDRYKSDRPADTFKADAESIFMIFDVLPRENPVHIIGQLFRAKGAGQSDDTFLHEEEVYLQTSQDSGFIEFQRPKQGWAAGEYKVKIHLGEKVTEASQIGTMRFKVVPAQ